MVSSPRSSPTSDRRRCVSPWRAARGRGRRRAAPRAGCGAKPRADRRPAPFGRHEREPHQQDAGQDGDRPRRCACELRARTPTIGRPRFSARGRCGPASTCRWHHSHHTSRPKDSASSASDATRAAPVSGAGRTCAAASCQHHALGGRDDLAPVARRQRTTQPRQQPAGGDERVARGADGEHPDAGRAGDVHAEHEDQERVDLHVEARAEGGGRPGAPRDPAVDRVEHQSHDREHDSADSADSADSTVTVRPR